MRLFRYVVVLMLVLGSIAMTQSQNPKMPAGGAMRREPAKTVTVYCCTHCATFSEKAGKCPKCKMAMSQVQAGVTYTCNHCHTADTKPGNCPKCKKAMKLTRTTYVCEKCKTSSAKSGLCSKCKKPTKRVSG